jgi:LPS-assembly protein
MEPRYRSIAALEHARASRAGGALTRVLASSLIAAVLACAALPASAQSVADRLSGKPAAPSADKRPDRMLVEAREMVYDRDRHVVTAKGDAQVYYQGKVLEADRVIYNQTTKRVYAEGNAKLTEPDGTITRGERIDLTDDFRDGFIETLRAETDDKSYFSAPRAERSGGDSTVYDKGAYTACEACKDDPSKPPVWRIRAKRIIHKNLEQMVYYEDATFELLGFPVAWLPYVSSPDPNVKRKTGILAPHYIYNNKLGFGVGIPIFIALAPNYDITAMPMAFSRQGFLGDLEWRHRLENGSYSVRVAGISQMDKSAFLAPPLGASDKRLRGSIESNGLFHLTDKWKFGWNVIAMTDRYFLQDYHVRSQTARGAQLGETTSSVFLTGKGDLSWFDLRALYFQGLSARDVQEKMARVHPMVDYNKAVDIDPARSGGVGGRIEIDANLTSMSALAASYEAVGVRTVDSVYKFYDVCAVYTRGNCLLRGIGGDYTRATLSASWKRQYVDPIGQVWTPFVFARMSGAWLSFDTTRSYTYGDTVFNSAQTAILGRTESFHGQVMPGVGLEYRYPWTTRTEFASILFEPIIQVISRPNERAGSAIVNMDAQSLVFDDSSLFEWNKYSGYDRFEGGTRLNAGARYTMTFDRGASLNLTAGQSFQLAGRNSYATADAANIGIRSGLDSKRSDYVAALTASTGGGLSFVAKTRFDPTSLSLRRLDLIASANIGSLTTSLQYARYHAQPEIGYWKRREGIAATARFLLDKHYFVQGNVVFDMTRHQYNNDLGIGIGNARLFTPASFGVGAGYQDECTTFSLTYSSAYTLANTRNQTLMMNLQLRTLGDAKVSQSLGSTVVQDGIALNN